MPQMDRPQAFVSETIKPVVATVDTAAMATGGPGLPAEFVWRGETLHIAAVSRRWKETGPCTHSKAESYVRKHWYEVRTTDNRTAKLYFERKPRGGAIAKRWWLYSIEEQESS